jgi:hypothetical protein
MWINLRFFQDSGESTVEKKFPRSSSQPGGDSRTQLLFPDSSKAQAREEKAKVLLSMVADHD